MKPAKQNVNCVNQHEEPGHLTHLKKFAICTLQKVIVDNLVKDNEILSGFLDIQVTINVGPPKLGQIVHVQLKIG